MSLYNDPYDIDKVRKGKISAASNLISLNNKSNHKIISITNNLSQDNI